MGQYNVHKQTVTFCCKYLYSVYVFKHVGKTVVLNRNLYSNSYQSFSGGRDWVGILQLYAAELLGVPHSRLKGRFPCG
jgi:hypothetical protein